MRHLICAIGLAFAPLLPATAGTVTISVNEVGGDVVFQTFGNLDLTGLSPTGQTNFGAGIAPAEGRFSIGTPGIADTYSLGVSGLPSFGSSRLALATSSSGTLFALTDISPYGVFDLAVSSGFSSGDLVDGSSTFAGKTLADLGIFNPFSSSLTLSNGQVIAYEIGLQPVPIPAAFGASLTAMVMLGGFACARRRKCDG